MTVELALAGAAGITVVNRSSSRGEDLVTLLNLKNETSARVVYLNGTYTPPSVTDVRVSAA